MQTDAFQPIKKILHLEDSPVDHELTLRALQKAGETCDVIRVESLEDFQSKVREINFDIILADYHLPGFTALDAWDLLQQTPAPRPSFCFQAPSVSPPPSLL